MHNLVILAESTFLSFGRSFVQKPVPWARIKSYLCGCKFHPVLFLSRVMCPRHSLVKIDIMLVYDNNAIFPLLIELYFHGCTFVRKMWWKALRNWRHYLRICFKMTWPVSIHLPKVGQQLHVLPLCLILMGRTLASPTKETLSKIQLSRSLKIPLTLTLIFKVSASGSVLSPPSFPKLFP